MLHGISSEPFKVMANAEKENTKQVVKKFDSNPSIQSHNEEDRAYERHAFLYKGIS